LLFSVPPQTSGGILDNIQFSTTPVPEPGLFGLFALSGVFLGCCRLEKAVPVNKKLLHLRAGSGFGLPLWN
jgi:hypothetical protein